MLGLFFLTKGWAEKNVYLLSNTEITQLSAKVENFISEMTKFFQR